jgi:NADPH:quinone reductase-like Zn-dependent oxidoreductase
VVGSLSAIGVADAGDGYSPDMVSAYGFSEYGGPEVQDFLDLDQPVPMAGELLVEVRVAGVNPVDIHIRNGELKEFMPRDLPSALGCELSGVVRGVGADVESFRIGDEVFGTTAPGSGAFAEYALITASASAHKPPHVSFLDAATLSIAVATAYDAVTQLDLVSGQTLLVNGVSGGVGVAAAQIARDLDVFVIGTASSDKQALVESLGATLVPYGDGVADRVRALMPDGVDAILDLAGGDGLRAVAELLKDRTKLVSAGDQATATELGGQLVERDGTSRVLDVVALLVAEGKLDPHVEDVISFERAADAVAAIEVGHAKGKVVVEISS